MANIDRISRVTIGLRTGNVRQVGFSGLLLIGVIVMTPRVAIITSADDLLTLGTGFTTSSPLYKAAQVAFSQIPGPRQLYIGRRGSAETAADAILAINTENSEWYGFTDVANLAADAISYAAWAEANTKLFVTELTEADAIAATSTGTASTLATNKYNRTAWIYGVALTDFHMVALAAKKFQTPPGGETWANTTLNAVPLVNLTETQYTNLTAKNGNSYEKFRNLGLTQNGIVSSGEWIDIIRFRDWLVEEVRTEVFNQQVDNRIPYTDDGIAIIRARVDAALARGVRRGGIAPDEVMPDGKTVNPSYVITVPRVALISTADKAARILRDVRFVARLAGAIHVTEIIGSLTYENLV